ncbi:MAG: thioredoxin family protein [Crocinitomicaceae bacterium]|nr:thioredoxin family protein [Crocinitomicaceae bacterium]
MSNCAITTNNKTAKAYSYQEYYDLVDHFSNAEMTSGPDQTADRIGYTKLNFSRMKRLSKTLQVSEALKTTFARMNHPQCWTVITESWCGDGSQNVPVLAKIAEASEGKIKFQVIFRDDNPEVMDQYLTNGGRAIPKLFARDENGKDLFTWGPRPTGATAIMKSWKENPGELTKHDVEMKIQDWYNTNKGAELMDELNALILQSIS